MITPLIVCALISAIDSFAASILSNFDLKAHYTSLFSKIDWTTTLASESA
jgi:hypothetical protein